MKKTAVFLIALMLVLSAFSVYADSVVTLYAPDGRTVAVYSSEVESYLNVGWFRTYEEVATTLYAPDGRKINVYNAYVEDYVKVGWSKTENPKAAVVKAYSEILDTSYDAYGYTLFDIDKNGVEELILSRKPDTKVASNTQARIYTYSDGNAVLLANSQYFSNLYTNSNKLYFKHGYNAAEIISGVNYNTANQGEVYAKIVYSTYPHSYYRNGVTKISESEYLNMISSFEPVYLYSTSDKSLLYQLR